jgi:hypothetical protein
MGPFIVGFDTLGYYVPHVLTWLRRGADFWEYLATTPLFYAILLLLASLEVPLTLSLKILPPLLHGSLSFVIYLYARKALKWTSKKSLFVALLATLYFVALRISWDMLRNEMGLIFLFIALIFLRKSEKRWENYVLLSLTLLLVAFTHLFVSVIMFFIVGVTIAQLYLNDKQSEMRRLVLSFIPAALVFLLIVYANLAVSPNFIVISGFLGRESEGWLSLFGFASYQEMSTDIFGFLLFCYLPLLPLVMLGFKKLENIQIKSWVLWILIAIFSPIISPNAFISGGYRWTLMLVFPFAFYAVEGFMRLNPSIYKLFFGAILTTLTLGFIAATPEGAFPYHGLFPYYIPSSMLQNTVSINDSEVTVGALRWFKTNMQNDAHLLVHDAFYGWALLELNETQLIPYGYDNPEKAAQEALRDGYNPVYLIWWTKGKGWHGQPTMPQSFIEVYQTGRIAIYLYNATSL